VIQPQYPEQWNLYWSNQSVTVTPLFSPYNKTRYEARLNVKLSNINLPNWMGRIDGLDRQNISRLLKNPLLTFDCKYSTTRVSFALRLMGEKFSLYVGNELEKVTTLILSVNLSLKYSSLTICTSRFGVPSGKQYFCLLQLRKVWSHAHVILWVFRLPNMRKHCGWSTRRNNRTGKKFKRISRSFL